jgi:hypothetical protein
MDYQAGEGQATTTIHYLLGGVPGFAEARVVRWFVEEGQRLRANDPLVQLQDVGSGLSVTLRVCRRESIAGAVVERISCTEGATVAPSEWLAVFTSSGDEAGWVIDQVEDLRDPARYPVASVDFVPVPDSLTWKQLNRLVPGYARWYFQAYPLVQLLRMAAMVAFLGLAGLFLHSAQDLLLVLSRSTTGRPWWDSLWLDLSPFFLGVLVFLILLALYLFEISGLLPRRRVHARRQVRQ